MALPACIAMACAVMAATLPDARSESGSVVVTMDVPSATSISIDPADPPSAGSCLGDTPGSTGFGTVLPGLPYVTTSDCTIVFGSSNDTSMLLAWQGDRHGDPMWRYPDGTLDDGWGTLGVREDDPSIGGDDYLTTALLDDQGRILAGGSSGGLMTVARYLDDGTPDLSFGVGGVATVPGSLTNSRALALALQPDGKIIAVGMAQTAGWNVATARFHPNGMLDTDSDSDPSVHWDTDGAAANSITAGSDRALDVVVATDGRVVVAGEAQNADMDSLVVAFRGSDGAIDTGFSSPDGYDVIDHGNWDQAHGIVIDDAGRYVVAGVGDNDGLVMRYDADGELDGTFSPADGIQLVDIGSGADEFYDVELLADGDYVLVGTGIDAGVWGTIMARMNPDGTLDGSFATTGKKVFQHVPGEHELADDVVVNPDGSFTLFGNAFLGAGQYPLVSRVTADGALDTTFSDDGIDHHTTLPMYGSPSLNYEAGGVEGADGQLVLVFTRQNADRDFALVRYETETIAGYSAAGANWAGTGSNLFGACLRSTANAVTDVTTWQPDLNAGADCADGDADPWVAVDADGVGGTTKVLEADAVGQGSATAHIRFGLRTDDAQVAGRYVAPLTFAVVAPAA